MGDVVNFNLMRNISNDAIIECAEDDLIDVIKECLGLTINIKNVYKEDKFIGVCLSAFYFENPESLGERDEVIAQLTSNALAGFYQDKVFNSPVDVAVLIMSLYAEQRDIYDECIA